MAGMAVVQRGWLPHRGKAHMACTIKDEKTGQIKHELIQYSVRTINNSQVSGITYPRKMYALYEKQL